MRFYDQYKEIIDSLAFMYPPNFEPLQEALNNGLNINVYDKDADYDMQDTLLSYVLDYYGDGIQDGKYMSNIVKFFLDKGYDVNANNGLHGALALKSFVYSLTCDKYSIESAKLLLDAGADPFIPLYDDNDPVSAYEVASEHDWDNRGLIEYDLRSADYYLALSIMFKRWKEKENYHSIQHVDTIIGQTVRGVYSEGDFKTVITYGGETRQSIYRVCIILDDCVLNAYGDRSFVVEKRKHPEIIADKKDCACIADDVIGHSIIGYQDELEAIPNWGYVCNTHFHIETDNGYVITFSDDYLEGPCPQKWVTYMEIKRIYQ